MASLEDLSVTIWTKVSAVFAGAQLPGWLVVLMSAKEARMTNYKIQPPQLDRQRNALRVEVIPPMMRCWLRPSTDAAAIIREIRPFSVPMSWSWFDYCIRDECVSCPVFKQAQERVKPFSDDGCVRPDREGWWFMNRTEQGWGSYGYYYKDLPTLLSRWNIALLEPKRDEDGLYYPIAILEIGD